MTIKVFCKQIEVVDYESFHYTDYCYCIGVFACLVPLNFFKSLGSITQAIIQYMHYILFCCILLIIITIIRI
jgi:hypothetical protein